mmetsp:Transcript_66855/g.126457  ORF Transcript_66855/g.126457 Transcript_66855/m.126457 type:complete len:115 (+) Transcript_66855:137-481(+)
MRNKTPIIRGPPPMLMTLTMTWKREAVQASPSVCLQPMLKVVIEPSDILAFMSQAALFTKKPTMKHMKLKPSITTTQPLQDLLLVPKLQSQDTLPITNMISNEVKTFVCNGLSM